MAKFTSETGRAAGKACKKKGSLTAKVLAKTKDGQKLVDALMRIVTGTRARNADRIKAATKLLEYGFGKPIQQVDTNVEGSFVVKWKDGELEAEKKDGDD